MGMDLSDVADPWGIFWCHTNLWHLMPTCTTSAQEVASSILTNYPKDQEEVEGMTVSKLTEKQKELEHVL